MHLVVYRSAINYNQSIMTFPACRFVIYLISLVQCAFVVNGTNVKWVGNQDPNAPEASRVPRSQKYWDEHKIERPDYAKTDAEVFQERILSDDTLDFKKLLLMLILFVGLWIYLIQKYSPAGGAGGGLFRFLGKNNNSSSRGGGGQKLGRSISSSSSSNAGSKTFEFGVSSATNNGNSLDDAARMARLSRFDSTKND